MLRNISFESKMKIDTFKSFISKIFSKKLLVLCLLAVIIPQAISIVMRLIWAILIILLIFLLFELLVVFMIKAWFPDRVNVGHVIEWTITTLLRVSSSLFSVLCSVIYSFFDLMFGNVWRRGPTANQQRLQLTYKPIRYALLRKSLQLP